MARSPAPAPSASSNPSGRRYPLPLALRTAVSPVWRPSRRLERSLAVLPLSLCVGVTGGVKWGQGSATG
ncbi:uncharacterized protein VTP21DRAFT_6878 [Calcarisporiella thermophila]|uniref:uncharacterized protein n=1 Tax=Calcarisporiella thermophila TaxID=911321 RepID=UPI00374456F4